jgi:hypothetical protein
MAVVRVSETECHFPLARLFVLQSYRGQHLPNHFKPIGCRNRWFSWPVSFHSLLSLFLSVDQYSQNCRCVHRLQVLRLSMKLPKSRKDCSWFQIIWTGAKACVVHLAVLINLPKAVWVIQYMDLNESVNTFIFYSCFLYSFILDVNSFISFRRVRNTLVKAKEIKTRAISVCFLQLLNYFL